MRGERDNNMRKRSGQEEKSTKRMNLNQRVKAKTESE